VVCSRILVEKAEQRSERQLNPTNVDLECEVENAILQYQDQVNRGVTDGSYGECRVGGRRT
jgi:hypothetical protein